jgi:hypothetical protein
MVFVSSTLLQAQWARTYGGSELDNVFSFCLTSDGGSIITGMTMSFGVEETDVWVLKLKSDGDIEWQKTYGGSNLDRASSIQQTDDGGYIIAGYTYSFGAGGGDIWILKLSSFGEIEWQRTYGGSLYDFAWSIQQTFDGGYILVGDTTSFKDRYYYPIWVIKLNSLGNIEWQRSYRGDLSIQNGFCIRQTSEGGYIVSARSFSNEGGYDIWVIKLNSQGDIQWQRTFDENDFDLIYLQSIQQTSEGGYILGGQTGPKNPYGPGPGQMDLLVIKLSSEGNIEWERKYQGRGHSKLWSIQQTYDRGYIIGGHTSPNFDAIEMHDIWVVKISPVGDVEWQHTYGGNKAEMCYGINQTIDGGYIVSGITESIEDGNRDILVLRLDKNGDIDPSCGFAGSSNAIVSTGNVITKDTNIIRQDTNIIPQETNISPQDTEAVVTQICARILTPKEQIENIIADVKNLVDAEVLRQEQAKPLIVKLDGALQKLEKDNEQAACNQLQAFINQINAYVNSGKLTPDEGQKLIEIAVKAIYELCVSLSPKTGQGNKVHFDLP